MNYNLHKRFNVETSLNRAWIFSFFLVLFLLSSPLALLSQTTLFFYEDFAVIGDPDPDNWEDQNVKIRFGSAIAPPNMGAAMFDGFDATGEVYTEATSVVQGDVLTSRSIDLSQTNEELHFSFYLQEGGVNEYPQLNEDEFIVQFLDLNGDWIDVFNIDPTSTSHFPTSIPFVRHSTIMDPILNPEFFHSDFKFRFIATISVWSFPANGQQTAVGYYDVWHLDEIILASDEDYVALPDLGFTGRPTSILESTYNSLSWGEFVQTIQFNLENEYRYGIFNKCNCTNSANNSILRISDINGKILFEDFPLVDIYTTFSPFEYVEDKNTLQPAEHSQLAQALLMEYPMDSDPVIIDVTYAMEPASESALMAAKANNEVARRVVFSNNLALDDGSPDMVMGKLRYGDIGHAIEFDRYKSDEIYGVAIYFQTVETTPQEFTLHVWDDEPDGIELYNGIEQARGSNSASGFTAYLFQDQVTGRPEPLNVSNSTVIIGVSDTDLDSGIGMDYLNPGLNRRVWMWDYDLPWEWEEDGFVFGRYFPMVRPIYKGTYFESIELNLEMITSDCGPGNKAIRVWCDPNLDVNGDFCSTAPIQLRLYNDVLSPNGALQYTLEFDAQASIYETTIILDFPVTGDFELELTAWNDCGGGILNEHIHIMEEMVIPGDIDICNDNPSPVWRISDGTYYGVNILSYDDPECEYLRDGADVLSGSSVHFKAVESITLTKDFVAKSGSDFTAKIVEVDCFIEADLRDYSKDTEDFGQWNQNVDWTIIPNPVIDQLSIVFQNDENTDCFSIESIVINNSIGSLKYERSLSESVAEVDNPISIDVGDYESGVYFVSLHCNDGLRYTQKFIKH